MQKSHTIQGYIPEIYIRIVLLNSTGPKHHLYEAHRNDFDIGEGGGCERTNFETTPLGSLENAPVLQIALFN